MSIVSICTGLKDFILDVNGMRRNYTEKQKNNTYNKKQHNKNKKKKTMTRLQDDEQALND